MTDLNQKLLATPMGSMFNATEASDICQNGEEKTIQGGASLFRAGDQGKSLYIVLDGQLKVYLGSPERGGLAVATVGPGQVVGELEVMTGSARVATLTAIDDSTVLELSGEQFEKMLGENRPAATKMITAMAKTLARRLAAVNQRVMDKSAAEASAKAPEPAPAPEAEPEEVSDADIVPMDGMDDDDLDVLDKLWG